MLSSPDSKRQKLADGTDMSIVSPKTDGATQTESVTKTASTSNQVYAIDQNAQRFEDVVCLDGFVDRTLLIPELLKEPTYVMMFAPSKFGKTINLNMIRFFFEIENKNTMTKEDIAKDRTMQELRSNPSKKMKVLLRQFEDKHYDECLILKQEKIVIQHFGRHVVILFNFQGYSPTNESEAIVMCAEQVRKAYFVNQYLTKGKEFQSNVSKHVLLKQTCKDWCSYSNKELKTLNTNDVKNGLKYLVNSLRIHWGTDPVFLVDEIDKPYLAAMDKGLSLIQIREIGCVISEVICSILKTGDRELKLQAALMTGISRLKNTGLSHIENTLEVYFLGDERFSKYYGLTAEEVHSLVKKFFGSEGNAEVTKIISKINTFYNGYSQRCPSGDKKEQIESARYCLFSVLSYIQQRYKNKHLLDMSFWTDGGVFTGTFMSLVQNYDVIMSAVQTLLFDKAGTIAVNFHRELNVENLLGIYREDMNPLSDEVFNFFLQQGLLAHNLEKPEKMGGLGLEIYLRIPNVEIRQRYYRMFSSYFQSLPKNVIEILTSCGKFFKSLLTENPTQSSAELKKNLIKLCEHLKCIFSLVKCKSEATICFWVLSALKFFAKYRKCEQHYKVSYIDNGKEHYVKIDAYGQHGNFAVIIEFKYNVVANGERSGSKEKSSLAAAEDIVTLLPGKQDPEDKFCKKAGTGRNLEVLKSSQIENYLLMGVAVDGDFTTHMLVFRNSTDWKDVIQVNPENHVEQLITKHLNSK